MASKKKKIEGYFEGKKQIFYDQISGLVEDMCDYFGYIKTPEHTISISKSIFEKSESLVICAAEIIENWQHFKELKNDKTFIGFNYKSIYAFISEGFNYNFQKVLEKHKSPLKKSSSETEERLNKLRQPFWKQKA